MKMNNPLKNIFYKIKSKFTNTQNVIKNKINEQNPLPKQKNDGFFSCVKPQNQPIKEESHKMLELTVRFKEFFSRNKGWLDYVTSPAIIGLQGYALYKFTAEPENESKLRSDEIDKLQALVKEEIAKTMSLVETLQTKNIYYDSTFFERLHSILLQQERLFNHLSTALSEDKAKYKLVDQLNKVLYDPESKTYYAVHSLNNMRDTILALKNGLGYINRSSDIRERLRHIHCTDLLSKEIYKKSNEMLAHLVDKRVIGMSLTDLNHIFDKMPNKKNIMLKYKKIEEGKVKISTSQTEFSSGLTGFPYDSMPITSPRTEQSSGNSEQALIQGASSSRPVTPENENGSQKEITYPSVIEKNLFYFLNKK